MIDVIGGGHAGCFAASLLAKEGFEVNIYEAGPVIGKPVQCTGIVTKAVEEIFSLPKSMIMNTIKVARVITENGQSYDTKIDDYIIDRAQFTQHCATMAEKNGAQLFVNHRLVSITDDQLVISHSNNKIINGKNINNNKIINKKRDIVVGADGPTSVVARYINPQLQRRHWYGAQALIEFDGDPDIFEVHLGSVAPNFFAWVVPEGKGLARVGLAVKDNSSLYFKKFLEKRGLQDNKIIEQQGGTIPEYDSKMKTQVGKTYLLGDAASQAKASTGGGIIQGLFAAVALRDALVDGKDYQRLWKKKIGKELWIHSKIRNIMNKFSDKDFNTLLSLFVQQKVNAILEGHDRDFPSKFLLKLILAEPRFLLFARYLLYSGRHS